MRRPLKKNERYLQESEIEYGLELLQNTNEILYVFDEVEAQKLKYKLQMDQVAENILSDPGIIREHRKVIMKGFQEWYKWVDVFIQEHFCSIFNVHENLSYRGLPHTKAFLQYAFARHYERLGLNLPDRPSDHYDRAHYTEAADGNYLITQDKAFLRTCQRIQDSDFVVTTLEDFAPLLHS